MLRGWPAAAADASGAWRCRHLWVAGGDPGHQQVSASSDSTHDSKQDLSQGCTRSEASCLSCKHSSARESVAVAEASCIRRCCCRPHSHVAVMPAGSVELPGVQGCLVVCGAASPPPCCVTSPSLPLTGGGCTLMWQPVLTACWHTATPQAAAPQTWTWPHTHQQVRQGAPWQQPRRLQDGCV